MFLAKIKSKLEVVEVVIFKLVNLIISFLIGLLSSKAGVAQSFSPFGISFLAVSPATDFSVLFLYFGIILGYITSGLSALNFKYICANTILVFLIFVFGKDNFVNKLYTPILPGILTLAVGFLFLFAESFTLFNILLLICESVLCCCMAYFIMYFYVGVSKKNKFDSKDIISLNIIIIITICALDSFYIFGFSVSAFFLQLIIYLLAYLIEPKISVFFILSLCFIMAILHAENPGYFLYFYIPGLITIMCSKISKKNIPMIYFISHTAVICILGSPLYQLKFMISPLITGLFYKTVPKKKATELLSVYINLPDNDVKSTSCNELCSKFCSSANELINSAENCFIRSVISTDQIIAIKKYLKKNKCKNIEINNFYSNSGKQILSVTYESDHKIDPTIIQNKIYEKTTLMLKLICDKSDGYVNFLRFEFFDEFKTESYALYKSKSGETVCGDNAAAFKAGGDNYYIILADGMGSGKEAYSKSNDTINLLKKILKLNVDPITAIKTVNSSLALIKDEIGFSTIDLCSISLSSGQADFYKCGAYQSVIARNGTLIKIIESGFPAGLDTEIEPKKQTVFLQHNDLIIMLSDGAYGVMDSVEALIIENNYCSPKEITHKIIDYVSRNTPEFLDDDITVIVSKITKNRNIN